MVSPGPQPGGAEDEDQNPRHRTTGQALANAPRSAKEIPGPVITYLLHPDTVQRPGPLSTPTAAPEGRRGPPHRPGDQGSQSRATQPRSLGESKARSASPPD